MDDVKYLRSRPFEICFIWLELKRIHTDNLFVSKARNLDLHIDCVVQDIRGYERGVKILN